MHTYDNVIMMYKCCQFTIRGIPLLLILDGPVQPLRCLTPQSAFSSDIKPENLLISSDDVLKLCDFGEHLYQTLTFF